MRAIAEEPGVYAERLEGAWSVEIGPSGPILDEQLLATHPGYICASGPEIEHPGLGRMRLPDAVVIPETVLDEEGLAVDATQVLAAVEIVSPSNPNNDYVDKLDDYPAMGIAQYMIVDPCTGTIEVHCEPCKGRYTRKEPYIYGDSVPFGPWVVDSSQFRRHGKAGG